MLQITIKWETSHAINIFRQKGLSLPWINNDNREAQARSLLRKRKQFIEPNDKLDRNTEAGSELGPFSSLARGKLPGPGQEALDVNCWQLLAAANRCRSHCSIVHSSDKTWSRWSSACCFYHFKRCNTLLVLSPRQISWMMSWGLISHVISCLSPAPSSIDRCAPSAQRWVINKVSLAR